MLQVTGHPSYGLPWGQDRLVPIFLATMAARQWSARITFNSAAEMLDTFGIQQGGSQYRRLVASFQRIFGATIFFGTDTQRDRAAVVHCARFNFMTEARIWYSRDTDQKFLPGDCQNLIVLSEEFYREISAHPIPTDLEAAKALSASPPALDLFTWLIVPFLHALGALSFAIGNFEGLTASAAVRRKEVRIVEDGSIQPVTATDHVAITGVSLNGAVASAFYRGGSSRARFCGGNLTAAWVTRWSPPIVELFRWRS